MEEVAVNRLELPRRPARIRGVESTNLRDLLKVRDDEATIRYGHRGNRNEAMTLATVLACEKQRQQPLSSDSEAPATGGRTLLDVIRLDEDTRRIIASPVVHRRTDRPPHYGISWKTLKSLLCLRRVTMWHNPSPSRLHLVGPADVETATDPTPEDNSDTVSIDEVGLNWSVTIREHIGSEQSPVPQEGRRSEGEPIRVSLMALLEEADRNGGGGGGPSFTSALMGMVEEADDGEEVEEEGVEIRGKVEGRTYVCCVCMVRHKGAAFIPCGHTFCRLCSRELWVSRGNCPLCNGFILEILDIF